ncbi:metallophosphoesterase [Streptomyces sp. LaPpAH-108]|uniref:metallophosphoesterase n=1 Tax=Streptomyces sp. LaPpAH-108 TaxID=1155714 RepID=UPI00036560B4|nr:metallophosphoesterase [Streptomyces sp. LaPpAH-108]
MRTRQLTGITATTDVHSSLQSAPALLAHLHQARQRHLVVDSGDWFEGTGYHQLGGGAVERQILTRLYDAVVPGNHGFVNYLRHKELHRVTVCANVDRSDGSPAFHTVHRTIISDRRVAVTGVMGPDAFDAIRVSQRPGLHLVDPARALKRLAATTPGVDSWVLLSHAGFDHDLALAEAVPHLDLVFAGHCHSGAHNPTPAGRAMVLKGLEYARGYAQADLRPDGQWSASHHTLPGHGTAPTELADITTRIDRLTAYLAEPLGAIALPWADTTPDRHALLTAVARHLHHQHGLPVVLSDSGLRPARLGITLTTADLLALEPFANHLVIADAPDDWTAWLRHHTAAHLAGPIATWPEPLPASARRVLTSDYIAETFLTGERKPTGLMAADAVHAVLAPSSRPAPHTIPATCAHSRRPDRTHP